MKATCHKLGDPFIPKPAGASHPIDEANEFIHYEPVVDDGEKPRVIPDDMDFGEEGEHSIADAFINMEALLGQGEEEKVARVIGRALDDDGNAIGQASKSPALSAMACNAEFPDGMVKEYAANTIAEAVLRHCDDEGIRWSIIKAIIDHRITKDALQEPQGKYRARSAAREFERQRKAAKGAELCCELSDGTTQWFPLKDLKESDPVSVAEYAEKMGLIDIPAFKWWAPHALKKKKLIQRAIAARAHASKLKYGIAAPSSAADAERLGTESKNELWAEATKKEMKALMIAFEALEKDEPLPKGYSKAEGCLIFDVKLDLRRKARWVKLGNRTSDTGAPSYAGVAARGSARVALTYAALNGMDVAAADAKSAYLAAPTSEKHFIVCGPECGPENEGKRALAARILYGGRCAGRGSWRYCRECMPALGCASCKAGSDAWMKPEALATGKAAYCYEIGRAHV